MPAADWAGAGRPRRGKDGRGAVTAPRGCFAGAPGLVLAPGTLPQGEEESRFSWGEVHRSKVEMEEDTGKWDKGTNR